MKVIDYYEVPESASSRVLFAGFPPDSPDRMISVARQVFEYVNNIGPVSINQIGKEFQDVPRAVLSQAVHTLRSDGLLKRGKLTIREDE